VKTALSGLNGALTACVAPAAVLVVARIGYETATAADPPTGAVALSPSFSYFWVRSLP